MTPDWMDEGLCRQTDPNLWFPESGESSKPAKKICFECPVIDNCLQYALDSKQEMGVWGGTSVRERRKIWLNA